MQKAAELHVGVVKEKEPARLLHNAEHGFIELGLATQQQKDDALRVDVGRQKKELTELLANVEQDFLELGSSMQQMSRSGRSLKKSCEQLIEKTGGTESNEAIQFSFQLLKTSEDLVEASYDQFNHVFGFFKELSENLVKVSSYQNNLKNHLKFIPITTLQISIHCSFYDEETQMAFRNLGKAMVLIATSVEEATLAQFHILEGASSTSKKMLDALETMVKVHKHEVADHLALCRSNLASVAEKFKNSSAAAETLTSHAAAIATQTKNVVVALQCQDRARQKIDHVAEAMDEMLLEIDKTKKGNLERIVLHQFIGEASVIQSKQINVVMGELKEAATTIQDGLGGIQSAATSMAEIAGKSAKTTEDSGLIQQMSGSIDKILAIIDETNGKITDIRKAIKPLTETFTDCTKEIRSLAIDIRYAALNAQIFAENIHNGAALAVLANSVRVHSDQIIEIVETISHIIELMQSSLKNVDERLDDFHILIVEERRYLGMESQESQAKLANADSGINTVLVDISAKQKEIQALFLTASERLKFPQLVKESAEHSQTFFDNLYARMCGDAAKLTTKQRSEAETMVALLGKKYYTMAHEFSVQAEALKTVNHGSHGSESDPLLFTNTTTALTPSSTGAASGASDDILFEDFSATVETPETEKKTAAPSDNNIDFFEDFSSPAESKEEVLEAVIVPNKQDDKKTGKQESEDGDSKPQPASPKAQSSQENLGDNVELF